MKYVAFLHNLTGYEGWMDYTLQFVQPRTIKIIKCSPKNFEINLCYI